MKYRILFITIVIILFVTDIFGKSSNDKKYQTNVKSIKIDSLASLTYDTTAYTINKDCFIDALLQMGNASKPWIARKEVAAWSATVLYFTIISVFISFLQKNKLSQKRKYFVAGLLICMMFLFLLFVHQQIGSFTSEASLQNAISRYIFETIKNNSIPSNFDFTFENYTRFPKTIIEEVKLHNQEIRKYSIILKPIVPLIYICQKIFGNRNISHIELEEAILYDMMILATIFSLSILFIKKQNVQT